MGAFTDNLGHFFGCQSVSFDRAKGLAFEGVFGLGLAEALVTQGSGNASGHPSEFQLDSMFSGIDIGVQGPYPLEGEETFAPIAMGEG